MGSLITKIFVIDDNPLQLEMIKDHFDGQGFEIFTYESGEEALKEIGKQPQIAILDYQLDNFNPGSQNGLEILKKLKAQSPGTDVIMLSGQDSVEIASNCVNNGAFEYLTKGESAFIRLEGTIKKINELRVMQNITQSKQKSIMFLAVVAAILAVVLIAILFGTDLIL